MDKNKYNNVKTARTWQGELISFSSKLEAAVFDIIMEREARGELVLLKCQDYVRIGPAEIIYIPDFKVLDVKDNLEFWIEAKGKHGPRWPTQQKAWAAHGKGLLEIWEGNYKRPYLRKIIVPKSQVISCPACNHEFIPKC